MLPNDYGCGKLTFLEAAQIFRNLKYFSRLRIYSLSFEYLSIICFSLLTYSVDLYLSQLILRHFNIVIICIRFHDIV